MTTSVKYFDSERKEIEFDPAKEVEKARTKWEKGPRDEPFEPPTSEEPDWSVVYDGDAPVVVVSRAHDGKIPKRPTLDDVLKNKSLVTAGDIQLTYAAAYHALRQTRFMMRQGPLNNIMPAVEESETPRDDLGHRPHYICEPVSPDFLYKLGEVFEEALRVESGVHFGQFAGLLARYYRGVHAGSGVCSTISAVVAGFLTTNFPDLKPWKLDRSGDDSNIISVEHALKHSGNSTSERKPKLCILNVSHALNHSFCLVSFGNSPWIVCDPWPWIPYIIPLEDNWFTEKDIDSWQLIEVRAPVKDPFGLPLMRAWDESAAKGEPVPGLHVTPSRIERALALYRIMSVSEDADMKRDDPFNWNTTEGCWVRRQNATRDQGPGEYGDDLRFHEAEPWDHESNHILADYTDGHPEHPKVVPKKLKSWHEYLRRNRPAAGPEDWGSGVKIDLDFAKNHETVTVEEFGESAQKAAELTMKRRKLEAEGKKKGQAEMEEITANRAESKAKTLSTIADMLKRGRPAPPPTGG